MSLPLLYLFKYCLPTDIFLIMISIMTIVIGFLNILTIKVKKPKGIAYPILAIMAIVMLVLFLGVL